MTEHQLGKEPDLDELRAGIADGKLGLHVQAVVSLPLGHAAGLEGFLRWYGEGAEVTPSPAVMRLAERLEEMRKQQALAAAPRYTATGNPGNLPALYENEINLAEA